MLPHFSLGISADTIVIHPNINNFFQASNELGHRIFSTKQLPGDKGRHATLERLGLVNTGSAWC
jgi:hypothetical protein